MLYELKIKDLVSRTETGSIYINTEQIVTMVKVDPNGIELTMVGGNVITTTDDQLLYLRTVARMGIADYDQEYFSQQTGGRWG